MVRKNEPWSLTKSDLINFARFQTIFGRKYVSANKIYPPPPHSAKKVIWSIFSPFQIISRGKKMFWVTFFLPPFPDSIQCLNFAKKLFIQYCFTQDSIQNIIIFKKNSADSIQKINQFNIQGIIDTGWIGKVPQNCPKSVQNRHKRGLFIKNGKYRG